MNSPVPLIIPAPGSSVPRPAAARALSGPVELVSVGDGDTIRVRGGDGKQTTIRLACIDAPERAQGESGARATATLRGLLPSAGRTVEIRPQTIDHYGRTIAEVYAGGENMNLSLVRSGAVYVYRRYLNGCDRSTYLQAEADAERRRLGVWRWGNEERPWDFRRSRRKGG